MPISGSRLFKLGWQIACLCSCHLLPALVTLAWIFADRCPGPGPGFFPFWLSLIGAVISAVMLVQVTVARRTKRRWQGITRASRQPCTVRRVTLQALGLLIA